MTLQRAEVHTMKSKTGRRTEQASRCSVGGRGHSPTFARQHPNDPDTAVPHEPGF